MKWLLMEQWSPYTCGIGIGLLSWISFVLSDKPIGCSTAYARTSGMIERMLRGDRVMERLYYQKFTPEVDWGWMLVFGIIIGSFLSSLLSGQFSIRWVPDQWAASFGTSAPIRLVVALAGGIIMGFGARWAGGCTSGHGISGTLQLAANSWLATLCFFISGIITAFTLYRVFAF